jgi:hypothetical protein
MMDDDLKLLHPDYLPVTEAQLDAHFATIVGDKGDDSESDERALHGVHPRRRQEEGWSCTT